MDVYATLLKKCEDELSTKETFFSSNLTAINSLLDIITKLKTIKTLEESMKFTKKAIKDM